MSFQIITDINKKGQESDLVKTAPSTYSLNHHKKVLEPKRQKQVLEQGAAEEEKINLATGFTGKAGDIWFVLSCYLKDVMQVS